jgi:glycosyltransferase involved in cell wall biosynthesis
MVGLIRENMVVGIDATNLRGGGTATHLMELLRVAQPHEHGFDQVIVWGGELLLNQIEDRTWLCKVHEPLLDKTLVARLFWQRFFLDRRLRQAECNILLVPGGIYFGSFQPFVTMCQNMLPFEWQEFRRFGFSWLTIKFLLLRISLLAAFKRANGIIFPTEYARKTINALLNKMDGSATIIPHGVDKRFREAPKPQRPIAKYSYELPFRLLYVSSVLAYKHQWKVMEAVYRLRQVGFPLQLELVGPIFHSGRRFYESLAQLDPKNEWIYYRGEIPFNLMHECYKTADLFVFASSCESISIALLEAMASGLPIASSNRGPMPEILDKAAIYFDPENVSEIVNAIRSLVENAHLREEKSWACFEKAESYTWKRSADETFSMLAHMVKTASQ